MKWLKGAFLAATTLTLGAATVPVVDQDMTWYRSYTVYADKEETDLRAYAEFYNAKGQIEKFEYNELGLAISDYDKLGKKGGAALRPNKKEKVPLIHSEKAEAAVAYDTTADGGTTAGPASITYSHTMPSNGTLVVATMVQDTTAADRETNWCTYNGDDMYYYTAAGAANMRIEAFVLPNADSGANNVVCTFNDAAANTPSEASVLSASFTGTDLSFPIDVANTNSGNSAQSSVSITTLVDGDIVVTLDISEEAGTSDITASGDNSHTERNEEDNTGGSARNRNLGTTAVISPAGAGTYSWDWTGAEDWVIAGLAVRPPCVASTATRCTDLISAVGTSTWTAPTDVTSIDVACWGGGGGGESGAATGNGGGGGGAYASTTSITVTPGVGYSVYVGAGGAAETAGERSHFFNGTTYSPIACGGSGATTVTGATGGTTACSVGSAAEAAGGDGANGTDAGDTGGGGGGAGDPDGTSSNGTAGNGTVGGAGGNGATTLGGTGGGGGSATAAADGAGGFFGGGGGGGGDNSFAGGNGKVGGGGGGGEGGGGSGGNGMCHISYKLTASGGGGGGASPADSIIWFMSDDY